MRNPYIVDTNVLIVANRRGGESYSSARACAKALLNIKNGGRLVIDDGDRILGEYRPYCSFSGQPGVGDAFFRWVHDNRGWLHLVETVAIASKETDPDDFIEFPGHPDLSNFDPSDRKFVAVANAHPQKPPILEASDSKWWGWRDALTACGITVVFLCPKEIEEAYNRKFGEPS